VHSEQDSPKERHPAKPADVRKREWLSQLEAASGKRIDTSARAASHRLPIGVTVLKFRCSKTGRPYSFALRRDPEDGLLVVHETRTEEADVTSTKQRVAAPLISEIDISQIKDPAIRECPHCGGGGNFVLCHCGGLSCQGAVRRERGKVLHKCPWCGNEGAITGYIKTVSAEESTARRDTSPSLPGGAARDALQRPRGELGPGKC
jgi:hypothetical protein